MFLSPLKPPTKASVSAEAINSSLYYLHVATPEDDSLLQEVELEREEGRGEMGGSGGERDANANPDLMRLNNVRRKPVGGGCGGQDNGLSESTAPPAPAPAPLQERPVPSNTEPLDQSASEPHGQHIARASTDAPPPLPQRPRRRPLPPVPTEEPPLERPTRSRTLKGMNRWSALSGYLNGRGLEDWKENWKEKYEALAAGRHSLDSRPASAGRNAGQSPTRKTYENRPSGSSGFHITLIRRDPTHGVQWNVATMSTPRMDGGPIDIEISTPGYNRFAAQDEPLSLASLGLNLPSDGRNPISLSGLKLPPESTAQHSSGRQRQSGPRKFHRQLCVSKPYHEDPRGSMDAFPRSSTDDGSPSSSRLKSGYYTFTSPWNGTCTFATSVNGRSLKCKHMIPSPTHAPVANTATQQPPNPAITAAELRFNTPFQAGHLPHQPSPNHLSPFTLSQTQTFHQASPMDPSSPPAPASPAGASKRDTVAQFLNPNIYARHRGRPRSHSNTSPHNPRPSTSSASSADADPDDAAQDAAQQQQEERMDLSLAREPAGGGMRGKSAKLGKLVVEDEGIKMLDLVVAACMAVWWKGYYY